MTGLTDRGFVRTTPIQAAVYPAVLEGRDLAGCAETGTGKTAAFLLPILHRLLIAREGGDAPKRGTRVLVLAPTRELAVQIEEDFQGLSYHTSLTGAAVYGGVGASGQAQALRAGVEIVVATPGRLLDHMRAGIADLAGVEVLVLDEADRMLDMGFWPDVQRIVAALPPERQTLLFSATMSPEVAKIARQIMRNPQLVSVGQRGAPPTTIEHLGHLVGANDKSEWLARFLRRSPGTSIVFVRTKRRADQVARRLSARGVRCVALHADRTQRERTAAVEGFKAGRFDALVATDIAARGIDIQGVAHVINFDVPSTPDAYVHRVGRTGRATATGTAITLIAPEEHRAVRDIERTLGITGLSTGRAGS